MRKIFFSILFLEFLGKVGQHNMRFEQFNNLSKEFGPHMGTLCELLQGKRIKLSTAAGGVILQIARLSTEMVDEHLNAVMNVAKMATGDQLKVCLAIRDQILGIKKN